MDERDSMSMTAYYGQMHAFVRVFTGEVVMVRDLAGRLEGQTPLRAFGWQAALDRARTRATRAVTQWASLNARFDGKVNPDPFERRVYGERSIAKTAQTAQALAEKLEGLNRFIDGLQAYGAEDVRWICTLADEMAQAVGEEAKSSSLVASYLERGAPDGGRARQEGEGGEGRETLSAYFEAFFRAGDAFRAGLE
jgi:hypothetical protein